METLASIKLLKSTVSDGNRAIPSKGLTLLPKTASWVRLHSPNDQFLSLGLWNPKLALIFPLPSKIHDPQEAIHTLIARAWENRQKWFGPNEAFRLIHGWADGLPDVSIDCLHGLAIIQTQSALGDLCLPYVESVLKENPNILTCMLLNDGALRQARGLPLQRSLLSGSLPRDFSVQEIDGTYPFDAYVEQEIFQVAQRPLRAWLGSYALPFQKALVLGSKPEWLFNQNKMPPCLTLKPNDSTLTAWTESVRRAPPGKQFDLVTLCLPPGFCDKKHQTGLGHLLQATLSRCQNETLLLIQSQNDILKLLRQISAKNRQSLIQLANMSPGPDFPVQAGGIMCQFWLYRLTKNETF